MRSRGCLYPLFPHILPSLIIYNFEYGYFFVRASSTSNAVRFLEDTPVFFFTCFSPFIGCVLRVHIIVEAGVQRWFVLTLTQALVAESRLCVF